MTPPRSNGRAYTLKFNNHYAISDIISGISEFVATDYTQFQNLEVEEKVVSFSKDRVWPYHITGWQERPGYPGNYDHLPVVSGKQYTQADYDLDHGASGTMTGSDPADMYARLKVTNEGHPNPAIADMLADVEAHGLSRPGGLRI